MQKPVKRLIVGIDPGTTAGYAVLDLSGRIMGLGSGRNLDLDNLVSEISKFGKPIVVGTDKAKPPGFVSGAATKFGAKLLYPCQDISIAEKRNFAAKGSYSNNHEMDALASAKIAFKKVESLLARIRKFAVSENKSGIFEKLAEVVIKREISIREAVSHLPG